VSAAGDDQLRTPLQQAIATLEADTDRPLQIATTAQGQLLAYLRLIGQWNAVYNLTAIRDPAEMLTQHLIDSLAAVGPLQRHLAGRPADAAAAHVLDVGSGARRGDRDRVPGRERHLHRRRGQEGRIHPPGGC
jgi:16S rRNA (guanine527-N7)-methyltransferase